MTVKKNEAGNLLPITVIEGITVNVLPNEQYEFLLSTKDVAFGYGVTEYNIRQTKSSNPSEFIEGKHFVKGVSICHTHTNAQPHKVFWTKAGIIRLGFFIRSERAKLFRDWAENLILAVTSPLTPLQKRGELPQKRNHNRLTSERLVRLLTLCNRISDNELRNTIVNELTGGQ